MAADCAPRCCWLAGSLLGGLLLIWMPPAPLAGHPDRVRAFDSRGPEGVARENWCRSTTCRSNSARPSRSCSAPPTACATELAAREQTVFAAPDWWPACWPSETRARMAAGDIAGLSKLIARLIAERGQPHRAGTGQGGGGGGQPGEERVPGQHEPRNPHAHERHHRHDRSRARIPGLDQEQRDFVGIIKTSAESLITIINDILGFSKIEAGMLSIERCPATCARSSTAPSSPAACVPAKTLRLRQSVAADVPPLIVSDQVRLRQILLNLVGNAVKFTEAGEVAIEVVLYQRGGPAHAAGGRARYRHRHCGRPAGRHFIAFPQADSSTTRRFGGTGLGLSITRRLVGLLGGRLWVDSVPGQGSCFHFSLPAEEAVAEKPAAGGEAALAAGMALDPGLAADVALAMPVLLVGTIR